MKSKIKLPPGIAFIAAGILILAVAVPGLFSSAYSSQDAGEVIPEPNQVQIPRLEIKNDQTHTLAENVIAVEQKLQAEQKLPEKLNYMDAAAYYVRVPGNDTLEKPAIPDHLEIPSIGLYAPVVAADFSFTEVEGSTFGQWKAPSFYAAGWHPDSALLGEVGNTVINGHHNIYGEVFGDLVDVQEGDSIFVYAGDRKYEFVVANRMILPETFMDTTTRLENAKWLAKSNDVRLTLVTCWPWDSYTHRLILVARPVE